MLRNDGDDVPPSITFPPDLYQLKGPFRFLQDQAETIFVLVKSGMSLDEANRMMYDSLKRVDDNFLFTLK